MHCVICFGSSIQEPWAALYCGHTFHYKCIQDSYNISGPKCPNCRLLKKGPKGELFMKLYIADDPIGGSESQVPEEVQGDDPVRLRNKIDLLNAKIMDMAGAIAAARTQKSLDNQEITRLHNELQTLEADLHDKSARLQKALKDYNDIAANSRKLQSDCATAKLNLEREKAASSRARLAYDTQITSSELSAQLASLAAAGDTPREYFKKLLECRNKAVGEANTKAWKAENARKLAEAHAKEEGRTLRTQIQNLKTQIEEYQVEIRSISRRQQQLQQQQERGTTTDTTNRKRPASWILEAETQAAAAASVRPINRPKKQQQQQQNNANFLPNDTGVPPNKLVSRNNNNNNIGAGGLLTKQHPAAAAAAAAARAGLDLVESLDGLLGPSSELPSMHPPGPMAPPLPRVLQRVTGPISAPTVPEPARGVEAPRVDNVNSNDASGSAPAPGPAQGERPRLSILEFRKQLQEKAKAAQNSGLTPPPPDAAAAAFQEEQNPSGGPIEWGTEVENAVANVDEEDGVIELIDTSEDEEEDLQIEKGNDGDAAVDPEADLVAARGNLENDPLASNNNSHNQQQRQHRPAPNAAISFLTAGPSKITLASAPGTSFIRNQKFATTGLKDDATFIHSGPDGKGGRVTYYQGPQGQQNGSRPAVARPAWGATMKDHATTARGGGVASSSGQGGKRGGKSGAGSSKPITQYFC